MGYLVNHVYCIACEFQTWTFDIMADLILNIDEEKDRFYAKRIERLAQWRYGKKRTYSMNSDDGEKYAEEKDAAAIKLDEKLERDNKKCVKGFWEIDIKNFGEELIPNFDKAKDKLFTPDHVIPEEKEIVEISLEHLLKDFFKTNLLNNKDNYYTCEKCRKTVDMEKNIMFITSTYRLYDLAPCVAISLKRFRQTGTFSYFGGGFSKINTKVTYPEKLDLTPYVMSKILKIKNLNRKEQQE